MVKRCRDSNLQTYCGVVSTLFGCCFGILSLHVLSLFNLLVSAVFVYVCVCVCVCVCREGGGGIGA